METKVKTVRKKKRAKRKPKVFFTEDNIVQILNLYHKEKLTMQEIGNQYGVAKQRIFKIIHENDFSIPILDTYDHTEVKKRSQMDEFERAKLISNDAQELAENLLSIANFSIKHTVQLLEENKDNPAIAMQSINIDKITKLIQVVAPYTMVPKKLNGSTGKQETPKSNLSKFMSPLRKAE